MKTAAGVVGAVGCLMALACGAPADAAPVWADVPAASAGGAASADLVVWPADDALRGMARAAAARIERATGLVVAVSDGATDDSVPLFCADSDGEWQGLTHVRSDGSPSWLMLDPSTPEAVHAAVVLHEILHALGAHDHVEHGTGVMSQEIWVRPEGWQITAPDLDLLCAAAPCIRFAPEAVQVVP